MPAQQQQLPPLLSHFLPIKTEETSEKETKQATHKQHGKQTMKLNGSCTE